MKTIKALKAITYKGMSYSVGEFLEVENNDAFALIDSQQAVLYTPDTIGELENKRVMRPSRPKGYKVK